MNPQYKLMLDATLVAGRQADNIYMRMVKYVPFVPREGDVLRLTTEDEEHTLDIPLEGVVYDCEAHMFVGEFEDNTIVEGYFNGGASSPAETIALYVSLGFARLNYPTAQAIRK